MRHPAKLAMAAFGLTLGSSLPAQVANSPTPSRTLTTLADMPNTIVRYYEVSGASVSDINRSIARQRPTSAKGLPVPAATDWAVRTEFDRTVTDGQCRVSAARATLTATADLPRLAEGARIDRPTRERWGIYVTELEQGSLVTLAFVYQNLATIEKVMLASDCDLAKSVAAAAIERLRIQTARLAADREKRLARQNVVLAEFQPGALREAKTVCRDLEVTGSRLQIVRACLPMREWDRMRTDSEEYMRGVQNQSILAKDF